MPAKKFNEDGSPHIHTYVRAKGPDGKKRRELYCCASPDCTHNMNKYFLEGKQSLCTGCAKKIILTPSLLQLSRPLCVDCAPSKEAEKIRAKKKILEEMGI